MMNDCYNKKKTPMIGDGSINLIKNYEKQLIESIIYFLL